MALLHFVRSVALGSAALSLVVLALLAWLAQAPWFYEKLGFTPGSGNAAFMEIKGPLRP